MSRQESDLCSLLVDETYGPLASRIYRALLLHGRCALPTLARHTHLDLKNLRHGLSILVQQHLIYWYHPPEERSATYEANLESAYKLIRYGTYLRLTRDRHGPLAEKIVLKILISGHASDSDLTQLQGTGANPSATPVLQNGHKQNGRIIHESDLNESESRKTKVELLQAGLITKVHESHFRTMEDNRIEAERDTRSVEDFAGGTKKERSANREAFVDSVMDNWKYGSAVKTEAEQAPKKKRGKRKAESQETHADVKRPRLHDDATGLVNGNSNDHWGLSGETDVSHDDTVYSINHAKFDIISRSERLVDIVEQRICKATSQVYKAVLGLMEPHLRECRYVKPCDANDQEEYDPCVKPLSTADILLALDDFPEMYDSLGETQGAGSESEDLGNPKKRRRKAEEEAKSAFDVDVGLDNLEKEHEEDDGDDSDNDSAISEDEEDEIADLDYNPFQNGTGQGLTERDQAIRSHLLLLAQHPLGFLKRGPRQFGALETWTVNFNKLIKNVQAQAITQTLATRYDTQSVRLASLLAERGKLDDKTLSSLCLIKEKEMRTKLFTMQKAGLLELQEVPRDNARLASRTTFLYFFDHERCIRRLTEECYQTLARCLERYRHEREEVKTVLEKASRSDVIGREEKLLNAHERAALQRWKVVEERIWAQIGRVDEMVALFRDF